MLYDQLEIICESMYSPKNQGNNSSSPSPVGYISFDANGNARGITDVDKFNTFDPGIQSSYLPYTADGSVINTNGSVTKLSPRNFSAQTSKNLLVRIQQKFPQFLNSAPETGNPRARGMTQHDTPLPNTPDIPSWMRGSKYY